MHEAFSANIQADVRHFAFNTEEQQIASAQLIARHRRTVRPQITRSPRQTLAGSEIGKMHQSAAIKSAGTLTAIQIRHANLLQSDRSLGPTGLLTGNRAVVSTGVDEQAETNPNIVIVKAKIQILRAGCVIIPVTRFGTPGNHTLEGFITV